MAFLTDLSQDRSDTQVLFLPVMWDNRFTVRLCWESYWGAVEEQGGYTE